MIPEEIAKKALDKLKVYGIKLNEAEHEEALNWLKTQILEYGEQQRKIAIGDESDCSHENSEHQNLRCNVCQDCGFISEVDV